MTFSNFENSDTDSFTIDLATYPEYYAEYFTDGKYLGRELQLKIEKDDLSDVQIKRIAVTYDAEPYV